MLTLSNWQHVSYDLSDLYRYVRRYEIPLEGKSILSSLGFIIRQYLYSAIEFKVNCRIGIDDRLISSCVSLLPSSSCTDFYVAFNVRRAQSWDEPNAVLFKYPTYSNQSSVGIQLDFFAKKQLKYMVMAAPIKSKILTKKRRGSAQSLIQSNTDCLSRIAPNIAIIYPQNNILWCYFKNKAKVVDQNAWLPIVSLWRQSNSNIVYMLRGSKSVRTAHRRKRAKSLKNIHIRSSTPSAPIPALSPTEKPKIIYKIPKQYRKRKKHKKKHRSQSNIDTKTSVSCTNNPCKLYEIKVTENGVICNNLFNFPHLNISHELTWFETETQSLLLVINKAKCIELQIIKHIVYPRNRSATLPQSTTTTVPAATRKKTKRKKRKMSASELFHMKLSNESLRIPLIPLHGYHHIFCNSHCLKLFYHRNSNTFIMLLQKERKENMRKVLLKLKINFLTAEIESMSYGIVNGDNNEYDIVGYDYNRSLLIVDTLYEPLRPLRSNVSSNKKVIRAPPSDIYKQYNKWFSFANKKLQRTKTKVITKQFVAFSLNDFVCYWKTIYDLKKTNHKSIIISK